MTESQRKTIGGQRETEKYCGREGETMTKRERERDFESYV